MSLRWEKFFFFLTTLLICGFVIAWTFFLNFGKFQVTANQPFEIHGLGKVTLFCETKNCLEKAPIGNFHVTFKAEGFEEIETDLEIRRWKTTEAVLTFQHKPVLISLKNIELKKTLQIPEKLETKLNPVWDFSFQKIAYFQKQNNLKIDLNLWSKDKQKFQKITSFYDFETAKIYWGKTGNFLLVGNHTDFFLVNLEKKLKDVLEISEKIIDVNFSPDDQKILFSSENGFFVYIFANQLQKSLNLEIAFENLIWKDSQTLLYFQIKNEETFFYEYDLENEKTHLIFTANSLFPQNLRMSGNGKNLLFESENQGYELRLVE